MNNQLPDPPEASLPTGELEAQVADYLSLRPATDQDTDFARNVHHQAYRDVVVKQFGSWDEAMQDKFFADTWAQQGFQILTWDNEPCGYARIEETPEEIRGHELVILPEFQSKSIGSFLLHKWQDTARERAVPLRLQVLQANRAAELYKRVGFKEIGRNDTHIEMEWRADSL